jgi:hypothetical protein
LSDFVGPVYLDTGIQSAFCDSLGLLLKSSDRSDYFLEAEPDAQKHGKDSHDQRDAEDNRQKKIEIAKGLFDRVIYDDTPSRQRDEGTGANNVVVV